MATEHILYHSNPFKLIKTGIRPQNIIYLGKCFNDIYHMYTLGKNVCSALGRDSVV